MTTCPTPEDFEMAREFERSARNLSACYLLVLSRLDAAERKVEAYERMLEALKPQEKRTLESEGEAIRTVLINSIALQNQWSLAGATVFVDTCIAQGRGLSADAARKETK